MDANNKPCSQSDKQKRKKKKKSDRREEHNPTQHELAIQLDAPLDPV